MGGKSDDDFEDDLEFGDESDDIEELNAGAESGGKVSGINFVPRSRRNWRDVERAREEREMRRLMNPVDDWMDDDFEQSSRRSRR